MNDPFISFCKRRFENTKIHVKEKWLSGSIQKICSNESSNDTYSELYTKIYKKFLKSNLKDSIHSTIPQNIVDTHLTMLDEGKPAILQIIDIVEIGVSTQKLYDMLNSYLSGSLKQGHKYKDVSKQFKNNVQDVQLPRSILKLTLTDGNQIFDAIECSPIKDLNLSTPIGTKISVNKTQILRGFLCLKPDNINVLGGFETIDQYKYLNVLLEKLKRQLDEKKTGGTSRINCSDHRNSISQSEIQDLNVNEPIETFQKNQKSKPDYNIDQIDYVSSTPMLLEPKDQDFNDQKHDPEFLPMNNSLDDYDNNHNYVSSTKMSMKPEDKDLDDNNTNEYWQHNEPEAWSKNNHPDYINNNDPTPLPIKLEEQDFNDNNTNEYWQHNKPEAWSKNNHPDYINNNDPTPLPIKLEEQDFNDNNNDPTPLPIKLEEQDFNDNNMSEYRQSNEPQVWSKNNHLDYTNNNDSTSLPLKSEGQDFNDNNMSEYWQSNEPEIWSKNDYINNNDSTPPPLKLEEQDFNDNDSIKNGQTNEPEFWSNNNPDCNILENHQTNEAEPTDNFYWENIEKTENLHLANENKQNQQTKDLSKENHFNEDFGFHESNINDTKNDECLKSEPGERKLSIDDSYNQKMLKSFTSGPDNPIQMDYEPIERKLCELPEILKNRPLTPIIVNVNIDEIKAFSANFDIGLLMWIIIKDDTASQDVIISENILESLFEMDAQEFRRIIAEGETSRINLYKKILIPIKKILLSMKRFWLLLSLEESTDLDLFDYFEVYKLPK
ncbi:12809_t:CDS:2 [Entrophospora sp. SA101]|nr:14004_t:CDS:2 [Entrophospora sp. SA101]CAJ0756786.1 12809_t:CDS:2 [Entrophospora sp. SA101]CAJ0829946.1 12872_t:CDS:2 [Entrophospora sp. SA101]CAJ0911521.1 7754_t:CDS:2 [Entrophospora sp. SA101]